MIQKSNNGNNDCLAYTYTYLAQTIFTFTNIFAIQHNFSTFEINIMRGILVLMLSYWVAKKQDIDLYYVTRHSFWLLIFRNFALLSWVVINVASMYYLSLATIYSINITGSLSVFVWDSYLYGVTINHKQKIGVALGLIGSFLMINCNYFLSLLDQTYEIQTNFQYFKSTSVWHTVVAGFVLLFGNIGMGLGFSLTKSIKFHKSGFQANSLFGLTLMGVAGIGIMLQQERQIKSIETYVLAYLFTAVPATLATHIYSKGVAMTKNGGIASMSMTISVLLSYFVAILRYGEIVNPIAITGSIFIVIGISMAIFLKTSTPNQEVKK